MVESNLVLMSAVQIFASIRLEIPAAHKVTIFGNNHNVTKFLPAKISTSLKYCTCAHSFKLIHLFTIRITEKGLRFKVQQ